MNCPYCDEAIHPLAKFCSKCGLPLKEDTTVAGAYLTDDSGPSPWVVLGGALAIVAIALTIGWMGSRNNGARPTESVRRDTVGAFPAPQVPAGLAMPYAGFNSAPAQGFNRASGPSATYNPSVRWAFNPAPLPAPRQMNWTPEPAPPPVLLAAMNPIIYRRATIVEPPRMTTPAIPPMPADVAPLPQVTVIDGTQPADGETTDSGNLPPGYIVAPNGQVGTLNANGVFEPATDRAPAYATGDPNSTWVWDPVHERWAAQTTRKSRSSRRVGGRSVGADDR